MERETTTEDGGDEPLLVDYQSTEPASIPGATVIFAETYRRVDGALRYDGDIPLALVGVYSGQDARGHLDTYTHEQIDRALEIGRMMNDVAPDNATQAVSIAERDDNPEPVTDGGQIAERTTDDYLDLGKLHEQESPRPNACRCGEQLGDETVCSPCIQQEFATPNPNAEAITTDYWGQDITTYDDPATGAGESCQCQSCGSRFHIALVAATEDTSGRNFEEFYECQNCGAEGSFRMFGEKDRREWTGLLDYPDNGGL